MPITTVYSPQNFLTTSQSILTEWLLDYAPNTDITYECPFLDESAGISRPILYLELMPGGSKSAGIGRVTSNTTKGNIYKVEYMANFIITNSLGGAPYCKQLGQSLYYNFLSNGYLLSAAKLKKPICSTYREVPKGSTAFFGGRHLITFEVQVIYTG